MPTEIGFADLKPPPWQTDWRGHTSPEHMIKKPFDDLVHSLAAKTPTPGGGSAAALTACLGAGLFLMVVRFSRGKKKTLEFDDQLAAVEDALVKHIDLLLPMAEKDCDAFDMVSKAFGLPKDDDEQEAFRSRAIQEGMHGAMVVPAEMIGMVRDVFKAMSPIITLIGKNIASDLGSGAHLLAAGAESAFLNVRINAAYLDDRKLGESALETSQAVLEEIRDSQRAFTSRVDTMMA